MLYGQYKSTPYNALWLRLTPSILSRLTENFQLFDIKTKACKSAMLKLVLQIRSVQIGFLSKLIFTLAVVRHFFIKLAIVNISSDKNPIQTNPIWSTS